jgi:CRISPR-associated protein Cas2
MLMLVSYDVSTLSREGRRRLRQVARACQDYGNRVQLSVFECEVDPAQWTILRARLVRLIDPTADSLRFYYLGSGARKIEHHGTKVPMDPDGPLIL